MTLATALLLAACRGGTSSEQPRAEPPADAPLPPGSLHPGATSSSPAPPGLPPLRGEWLEALPTAAGVAVVTPPLGATAPSRVVLGVHGAGDRPEWSCGGWRLASESSAFVVCPRGRPVSSSTFAWSSAAELQARSDAALSALHERYGAYLDDQAAIYAGFSQGVTLAEKYLRTHATRFPITILAEGGYAMLGAPAFARAYSAAGGQRLVLVCGTPGCFTHARRAQKLLQTSGLQILVVGDERAGHNLNERMQHALQNAWADISAPLPPRP